MCFHEVTAVACKERENARFEGSDGWAIIRGNSFHEKKFLSVKRNG